MCAGCEERDEKIRQLEHRLYGRDWEAPRAFRFTPLEEAVIATLIAANGRTCSTDFLIDATRGRNTHQPHPTSNLIDTKVCHIRAKLRPYNILIETVWGRGYRLSDKARDQLLNWPTHQSAAA